MAYEFHYTPTGTGVISGKEVLEQTEDAINDLGNTAISGVQEALDKAEQALTNSENAVDDAQTALNTANNAEGVAIQAQTDVSNLSGTVTNIGNRVTTAEGNITNLQGRMTTAEGNVTNLQGRMTTAEGNIGNLQTAVSTAQATANSAQQTATTARQQSYVFRYSSTALTPSSTNSNALLDNTDNLKVGDKVIDSSGVLFSVTAIDTANSTFTIGTALIDLAQDSDVVHTNRNDDVSIPLNSTSAELGVTGGNTNITFLDKNDKKLSGLTLGNYGSSKLSYARLNIFDQDTNNNEIQDTLEYAYYSNNNNAYLRVSRDNFCALGTTSFRWKGVYAQSYYYGSDNTEFSTKFVTTDTSQSVSGQKVFTDINAISSSAEIGVSAGNNSFKVLDKNKNTISRLEGGTFSGGMAYSYWLVNNGSDVFNGLSLYQPSANLAQLRPYSSELSVQLGASFRSFSDCYTSKINNLEPSSLSLPSGNVSDVIDISGYLTILDGSNVNTYVAPANGWISILMNNCSSVQGYITNLWGHQIIRPSVGSVRFLMPVLKNQTANILIIGGTIGSARFIPCQGNV